jgi:hypothetical protein
MTTLTISRLGEVEIYYGWNEGEPPTDISTGIKPGIEIDNVMVDGRCVLAELTEVEFGLVLAKAEKDRWLNGG